MSSDHQISVPATTRLSAVGILLCFVLFDALPQPLPDAEATPLRVGSTLTATQHAEGSATYSLEAVAGETYLIEVEQQGLDFIVRIEEPGGAERVHNTPLMRDGSEFVLLENTREGRYAVTISSKERTGANGRYEISVSRLAAAGTRLSERFDVWRHLTAAAALNASADSYRDEQKRSLQLGALDLYESARVSSELLGEPRLKAYSTYGAAALEYAVNYSYERALSLAEEAGTVLLSIGDESTYAGTAILQALALVEMVLESGSSKEVQFQEAVRLLESAREIYEERENSHGQARAELYMGLAHFNVNRLAEAKEHWQNANTLFSGANEWRGMADARFSLAVIDIEEGYQTRAIALLESIRQDTDDWDDTESLNLRGRVLDNLAAAYRHSGRIDAALRAHSDALAVHLAMGDLHGAADSHAGLAGTYFAVGEYDVARQYALAALADASAVNNARVRMQSQTALGNIAYVIGDYERALEHHSAALSDSPGEGELRARQHVLVSKDLGALGDHSGALRNALTALELADAADSPLVAADARFALGRTYVNHGELERAIPILEDALARYEYLSLPHDQVLVLSEIARAARMNGRLDVAIGQGGRLLGLLDDLRSNVSAPELRAFFSARRHTYYENQIDVLMEAAEQSSEPEILISNALEVSERGRARMTLDLMTEASVSLDRNVDAQLLGERDRLYEELEARRYRRDAILQQSTDTENREERLDDVLREMAFLESRLFVIETEIRNDALESGGLVTGETLGAAEIRRELDDETVLLQYALGASRSFVFVVTKDEVRSVTLATRHAIESAAKSAYESIATPAPMAGRSDELKLLSSQVLSPVLDFVEESRVIVVAADGALLYVPFGALLDERTGRRLVETHEIVSTPSISALHTQRARDVNVDRERLAAVFADPVFERTDPRIEALETQEDESRLEAVDALTRSWVANACEGRRCRGGQRADYSRLPATMAEARAIAELDESRTSLVISGFDASRETVLRHDLSRYRYVHFATHGLLDSRYPALSALVFSQYTSDGGAMDGLVRLADIYALDLNAELVVLSACETALGQEMRGEGLIGLTQGFMYAGARSVLASLWKVSDAATADLMTKFYGFMLQHGQRPAMALRNAQLAMASSGRYRDPYYWSGFVFMGDWQ